MKPYLSSVFAVSCGIGVFFLGHASALAADQEPQAKGIEFSIKRLGWLTGSWQGPIGEATLEEKWLAPRANTICAVVRLTKQDQTEFVELIKIGQRGDTVELRLNLFDTELKPRHSEPHHMKAVSQSRRSITFQGVTEHSHRSLHYELLKPGHFVIRLETAQGDRTEIHLVPIRRR